MAGFSDLLAASAESLIIQDLRVRAGSTWLRSWTFYDDVGDLVDFTGGTATLKIKNAPGGTELTSFTQTLASGKQILLTEGTVSVTATAASTSAFATTTNYAGVYELKVTIGGETVTVASGKITIYPSV